MSMKNHICIDSCVKFRKYWLERIRGSADFVRHSRIERRREENYGLSG